MKRHRLGRAAVIAAGVVCATPSVAAATLSITVPSAANLGSAATGTATRTAQLGTVTVSSSGVVGASFIATVSSTNFTTGSASANETITRSSIAYWSGPATANNGLASFVPGQLTAVQAVTLSSARTAFSGTGLLASFSVSWNPTLVVSIPSAAVAGAYTGTITHSVA